MNKKKVDRSFREMSVRSLSNYMLDVEHPYMKKSLAAFILCAQTIAKREHSDEAEDISAVLLQLETLVQQHFDQDEQIVLPFLANNTFDHTNHVGLPVSLKKIKAQHHAINRLFRKLRKLSNNYTTSEQSAPTLKLCYAQLFNFEQDMLKHTLLEEDILFPKLLSGRFNH